MRSPHYKHYTLADLEWLVLPPLLTGQFSVAEAGDQQSSIRMPVAVALWANVSAEVDRRLSENLSSPMRLRPDEWRSGDIPWLVDAVGDARVVPQFLKQLSETAFKGCEVKMRVREATGRIEVKTLAALSKEEPKAKSR
jgi:hemolysin-activating ACP:hemolysin acyltransferase